MQIILSQLIVRANVLHRVWWLSGCLLLPAAAQPDPSFWQRQSIYQIITDRFFDGDPSNNNAEGNFDPKGRKGTSVHGGDFKGVGQKLDYVQALGATAIWISPIVLNANGEFHGYAGRDFYTVAPHFGTMADLQRLTAAAHARGMLVIQDVVVNHGGNLIDSADLGYPKYLAPPGGYHLRYRGAKQFAPPFNTNAANPVLTNLFHNHGFIGSYSDPQQVELGELSGLDDFRTESPYVRSNMAAVYEYWIEQANFDGFRIDTVKHVEMGFWQQWCPQIRAFAAASGKPSFFMFGEVLDGSDPKCGCYTGVQAGGAYALDSVLDYPLYFKIGPVFAKATGPTKLIEDRYSALIHYDLSARDRLVTFLDNHDQPRFLSPTLANDNIERLKNALVFLYTARGVPCLYYGTEQGFNGKNDPYDREDMFAGQFEQGPSLGDNFNMTHPLFQWVAMLNNFRRLYPALQTGLHSNICSDANGPGLLAFSRRLGQQEVLVVINTANSPRTLPSQPTLYAGGTTLVNLVDTNETAAIQPGSLTPPIRVPGTSAKLFVAKTQWFPLDPVVTRVTPAHDATNVSTKAAIVLQFSQPMRKDQVEAGFVTIPSFPGSFEWSKAGDTMTYTPKAAGFPAHALVTVYLCMPSRAVPAGKHLHDLFKSRFTTGPQ